MIFLLFITKSHMYNFLINTFILRQRDLALERKKFDFNGRSAFFNDRSICLWNGRGLFVFYLF